MHTFLVIGLLVIVSAWVLSVLAGRFSSKLGTELSLLAGLVARIAVVGVMIQSTAQVIGHGGWLIALVPLFVLIAVFAVLMGGLNAAALWLSLTGRVDD